MAERKHDSENDVIAYGTDPWLQCWGMPVDLTQFDSRLFPKGVFAPVNDDYGIERVDEGDEFESDFEAAQALADYLSALTGLSYEVWFDDGADNQEQIDSAIEQHEQDLMGPRFDASFRE